MKPNTVVQILLGVAVGVGIYLSFFLVKLHEEPGLSESGWVLFMWIGMVPVFGGLGAFLSWRWRNVPAPDLTAADVRLCIFLAAVGCGLAVAGVISGMWWLMALGILLAPLVFAFRGARMQRDDIRN